ncbi:replication protein A, subunit RPA32 [Linnemannia elongata AG-77]|uniref:Replication protein A, subunit RPA32 n=1 Tax=Linnemannia elongata AG-77 TaxID=1314771 RepID=A0A197KCI0_9FUNG|nr:replication protein A, subunit RPA32 [Linnemannia elongata AG-77]
MSNYNRGGYSSSQGQGFVQDSFGNDGTAPKRTYIHTLRPVTIKQILAATQTQADGDFKIDGQDIGQVTLIAAVRNINQASTQNIYMIEDGTGVIDAKKYPSDHDDPEEVNSILLNTYARIVGTVKMFNQKQYIQVHSIRPVTNMNEVTYHNLEVLTVHVSATRSKVGGHGASSSSSAYGQHHNSMHGVTSTDTHMRGGNDDVANSISDFIDNHPGKASGLGAHRRDIIGAFAQRLGGEHKVNEMLKTMEEDGHLYVTEDDDHFNTTH